LYPPRPEYKVSIDTLKKYDNGQYIAQPKLNGSNGVLILDKDKWELWNRHRQKMTLYNDKIQFGKLYRGNGEMVLNGEYLNKNKKDGTGKPFNHKFIIFDILKYNGEVLTGKTFVERIALLDELYPCKNDKDEFICALDIDDIYRVKNFQNGFEEKYKDLVKIDMYEGLVLKRKNAKLEPMFREGNNSGSMVKVRKETKNYKF
jgi:ATP-dependent DNA ligase